MRAVFGQISIFMYLNLHKIANYEDKMDLFFAEKSWDTELAGDI